jgi:hypothetical protein
MPNNKNTPPCAIASELMEKVKKQTEATLTADTSKWGEKEYKAYDDARTTRNMLCEIDDGTLEDIAAYSKVFLDMPKRLKKDVLALMERKWLKLQKVKEDEEFAYHYFLWCHFENLYTTQ